MKTRTIVNNHHKSIYFNNISKMLLIQVGGLLFDAFWCGLCILLNLFHSSAPHQTTLSALYPTERAWWARREGGFLLTRVPELKKMGIIRLNEATWHGYKNYLINLRIY